MGSSLFGMQARTAQELAYIAMDFISKNIANIIGSIIILAVAWAIALFLGSAVKFLLLRRNADITITKFLVDILRFLIICVALLIALGNFGITIAPFVAGLGAAGFGLSFAFQGPLSNYASGATLIFTKPFRVGDVLEVNGQVGLVENMTLARTLIRTVDGAQIVIPNRKIIGEMMLIHSRFRRIDIKVGVSYGSDIDKTLRLVRAVVDADKRITRDPRPVTGVLEFADSSIIIYARIWCPRTEYWDVTFDVNKAIMDSFRDNGVTIPFPQRDVHIVTKEK